MDRTGAENTIRVALYIRVSTDEQTERYGIPLQKDSLLNALKSRGKLANGSDVLALAGEEYIYIDDGISGTIPVNERPAFSRLKEDILNAPEGMKPFDMVAVYKIDRFARRLKILLDVIDFFDEYDIKFLSINESIDTSTPFGKAILGIVGVIAELELETIKLRTQDGREAAARQGKAMGAFSPYGFVKNTEGRLERFGPEAKIVEYIFDLFVNDKKSTQSIANILTREKILSPSASAVFHNKRKSVNKKNPNEFWVSNTVIKILQEERYIGKNYYNRFSNNGVWKPKKEWKLSEYRLPQIVNPLTFSKAQDYINSQKHERKNTHSGHTYLLSGLLRCYTCGNEVAGYPYWVGGRKKLPDSIDHYTYFYQCGKKNKTKSVTDCRVIPLPAKEIEDFVLEESIRIVRNPQGVFDYQKKLASSQLEIKQLQKRQKHLIGLLNSLPQQRELIRVQHKMRVIDSEKLEKEFSEMSEREKVLRAEIDTLEERLSQRTLSEGYIKGLEMFSKKYEGSLGDIKKDRQKAYELIHSLVDSVHVYSRPVVPADNIAGKKKKGQGMPHEMEVKIRLPREFLTRDLVNSGQKRQYGGDGGNRTRV